MYNCETCRGLMLEYLYGLLENEELQFFREHLDSCSACQAELDRAKGQQRLLAKAAKMEFPDVRFTAPATPTLPSPNVGEGREGAAPAVIHLRRSSRPPRWRRWAMAAAVLLFLGAAAPAVWYGRDYLRTEEAVAQGERRLA